MYLYLKKIASGVLFFALSYGCSTSTDLNTKGAALVDPQLTSHPNAVTILAVSIKASRKNANGQDIGAQDIDYKLLEEFKGLNLSESSQAASTQSQSPGVEGVQTVGTGSIRGLKFRSIYTANHVAHDLRKTIRDNQRVNSGKPHSEKLNLFFCLIKGPAPACVAMAEGAAQGEIEIKTFEPKAFTDEHDDSATTMAFVDVGVVFAPLDIIRAAFKGFSPLDRFEPAAQAPGGIGAKDFDLNISGSTVVRLYPTAGEAELLAYEHRMEAEQYWRGCLVLLAEYPDDVPFEKPKSFEDLNRQNEVRWCRETRDRRENSPTLANTPAPLIKPSFVRNAMNLIWFDEREASEAVVSTKSIDLGFQLITDNYLVSFKQATQSHDLSESYDLILENTFECPDHDPLPLCSIFKAGYNYADIDSALQRGDSGGPGVMTSSNDQLQSVTSHTFLAMPLCALLKDCVVESSYNAYTAEQVTKIKTLTRAAYSQAFSPAFLDAVESYRQHELKDVSDEELNQITFTLNNYARTDKQSEGGNWIAKQLLDDPEQN